MIRDLTEAVRGVKGREREDIEGRMGRLEERLLEQGRPLEQLVDAELFRRQPEVGTASPPDAAGHRTAERGAGAGAGAGSGPPGPGR